MQGIIIFVANFVVCSMLLEFKVDNVESPHVSRPLRWLWYASRCGGMIIAGTLGLVFAHIIGWSDNGWPANILGGLSAAVGYWQTGRFFRDRMNQFDADRAKCRR